MTQIAIADSSAAAPAWRVSVGAERPPARPALAIETPRLVLRTTKAGDGDNVELTILLKPNLSRVGWVRFSLEDDTDRAVELSFFLDPAHRGRGLMREAARAAAPRALRLLGARCIRATLPADAHAAHGVARSLGLAASAGRGAARRFEKDLCGLI